MNIQETEENMITIRDVWTNKVHRMLLDTGATCNVVGKEWARNQRWPTERLGQTTTLEVCGGTTIRVREQTWRKIRCTMKNGRIEGKEAFLVVPESLQFPLLGKQWIKKHRVAILSNGSILLENENMMQHVKPEGAKTPLQLETSPMADQRIFRARTRIIQGEIQTNDPPEWVLKEFPEILEAFPEDKSGLPPSRGKLDYQVHLKEGFVPEVEPGRRSFTQKEQLMFKELAAAEEKSGRWQVEKHPLNVAEMLWAAKAGGEKRPCIDYRHVNQGLVDDGFQLPLTKQQLHELARARMLTSMDIPKAYNQVLIKDQRTRRLLSFRCNGQVYSPTVMQFGSKTAVSHFQRFITTILGDIVGNGCKVYLDNIVVHGINQSEHDTTLRKCLTRLRDSHLNVKKSKCEWGKPVVQFCGFFVGGGEIKLDPEKIRAIQDWPEPDAKSNDSLKTQIREFLGFCNFYRDAFDHYSGQVEALTRLTGKNQEWTWGDKERGAFNDLKKAAMALPTRMGWDPEKQLTCHADASDRACAMVYQQENDKGELRPIGFYSKKFDKTQAAWPTYDKEFAAISWGLASAREWVHCGLSGKKCVVYTDHKALIHWMEAKNTKSSRHQRWADDILQYDNLEFRPIKGKDNWAADALSRKDKGGTAKWEPTPLVPREKVRWVVGHQRPGMHRHMDWVQWENCATCGKSNPTTKCT